MRSCRAPTGSGSRHVERVFAAYDALGAELAEDGAVLAETFQLVSGHQLTQQLVFRDGAYAIADATVVLEEGRSGHLIILVKVDG